MRVVEPEEHGRKATDARPIPWVAVAKGVALFLLFYGLAYFIWAIAYGLDNYDTSQEMILGAPKVLLVAIAGFFTWPTMKPKKSAEPPPLPPPPEDAGQ